MATGSIPAATLASSIRWNNSLAVVALTMLYYDYCLTFQREIEHFWKRARFTVVSTLFVTNRYLGLLGPIPVVLEYFVQLPSPRFLQRYHQYYAIISQVIVGVVLIARTFALYNRSRRVLVALIVLGCVLVATTFIATNVKTIAVTANASSEHIGFGCDLSLTAQQGLRSAVGWFAMLCLDTTIFALTVIKSVQMRHSINNGLLQVLIRDGSMYYAILVVANIANILTFMIGDSNRGLATTLTNALSTTLISRICLNLRDPSLLQTDTRRIGRWSLTQDQAPTSTVAKEQARLPAFHHPTVTDSSAYEGDIWLTSRTTASSQTPA
ncbi:hypothetical protein C8Q74DRAFT_1362936 [Fomes fomentarius]|nr:hypothetical protein C8Q74DRAFT_1362936 [Fomes fomentarius]